MTGSWRRAIVTTAAGFALIGVCEPTRGDPTPNPPAKAGVGLVVKEKSLGQPPAEVLGDGLKHANRSRVAISPDGKRIAYTQSRGTGFAVTVDGEEWSKRYASITTPVFSPDGKRVACVVSDRDGSRVVIDGSEGSKPYPDISGLRFSPDGRLAFAAVDNSARRWWYVINGNESDKVSGPFLTARDDTLLFSPDGKHYAFTTWGVGNETVILDGKKVQTIESGGPRVKLRFTAAGQLIYVFHHPYDQGSSPAVLASHGTRGFVTYGGKADRLGIDQDELRLSSDGKCMAAIVSKPSPRDSRTRNRQLVVWDAETLKVEAAVDVHDTYFGWHNCKFTFAPDGKRFGFISVVPDKRDIPDAWSRRLVIDGKEVTSDGRVWNFAFSPDSKRVAYTGDMGLKPQLVVDGRTVEKTADKVDAESRIVFSPDGTHVVVTAGKGFGKKRLLYDGEPGKEYDEIEPNSIRFSADGKRFAYVSRERSRYRVVTDGVEGNDYDGVNAHSLRFSPDGKHLAYQARRGRGWVLVVDGAESRGYDSFPSDLVFDGPDSLHMLGERGAEFFRIEVSINTK